MAASDDKKPGIFDRLQMALQAQRDSSGKIILDSDKKPIIKGNVLEFNRKTKALIILWGICIALIFFIFPLMIGMLTSGFVDFGSPVATVLALIIAGVLVGIGGFAP